MATPQLETRCEMDRGKSPSLQLLQETTHLGNSGRNMSSTGGLVANNSSSALQLETIIVSKERLVATVLHLHLGFFSWNSFHALHHFLDHKSINIKLQSLAHFLWRLTHQATLHSHFTQAYRASDTLPSLIINSRFHYYDKNTFDEAMNTTGFFLLQQVSIIHGEVSHFVNM